MTTNNPHIRRAVATMAVVSRGVAVLSTLAALAALTALTAGEKPMFTLETEIDIDAQPQAVWQLLTEQGDLGWNPFIHQLDGNLTEGAQLTVRVGLEEKKRMTFKPKVLTVRPDRELRWRGKLLLPGVFDGEHVFELQPTETGTRFLHYERFSGVLVPLFQRMLERDTRPGFEAMNRALKQRAEADAGLTAQAGDHP